MRLLSGWSICMRVTRCHGLDKKAGSKTPRQGGRLIFVIGASIAQPRECVWVNSWFCCRWVREFNQNLLWQVLVRDSGLRSRHISKPNLCTFMRSYSKWRWNLRLGDRRRSADRKSIVPALEFSSSFFLNYPKQEFMRSGRHVVSAQRRKLSRRLPGIQPLR